VITICTLATKIKDIVIIGSAATLLMLSLATTGHQNTIFAQPQMFTAKLSGSNEVPSVTTAGSGIAIFQLSADGKSIHYQVNLKHMNSVMGAHIHNGKQGENGPVVADLFGTPSMSGPPTGAVNGQLAKGTLTSSDLTGPLAGKQISALAHMIKSGEAYVNVHTTQNQNGEIRGQIS
jgi:hypothetical protein